MKHLFSTVLLFLAAFFIWELFSGGDTPVNGGTIPPVRLRRGEFLLMDVLSLENTSGKNIRVSGWWMRPGEDKRTFSGEFDPYQKKIQGFATGTLKCRVSGYLLSYNVIVNDYKIEKEFWTP